MKELAAHPSKPDAGITIGPLAHPLDVFYERNALPMPAIQQVDAEEIPQPYRTLLVHTNDMTSTLEQFHRGTVHLRVMSRWRRKDEYFREVVLHIVENGKPVEFGAIKICLDLFPAQARQQILEEHWPLGRVLRDSGLYYISRPVGFLRIASDRLIGSALGLTGVQILHGRHNMLLDGGDRIMAEIVEILPLCADQP